MPERGLALVHAVAPPVPGGTNVVLARLLRRLDRRLEVFTDGAHRGRVAEGGELLLDGRYRYFPRLGGRLARFPGVRALADAADVLLALGAGVRIALGLRGTRGPLLSVTDGGYSPLAGALAARLGRRPHVTMVFDLWEENAYSLTARLLARVAERRIMRSAAAVVVYCPEAADHYRAKHGVECSVIDTPIDLPGEAEPRSPRREGPAEILVGGAIYWAQEDAVRRLLRAAGRVEEARVTIVGDEASLRARGIDADSFEAPLPGPAFQERLRAADVLFLGLSLHSPHPEVVRTATPARLPECMAAGRPLLVHAPRGSHAAAYAAEEDFAEVVDTPDDVALEQGIRALVGDRERAAERAERAARLARERHDADRVAEALERILAAAERG